MTICDNLQTVTAHRLVLHCSSIHHHHHRQQQYLQHIMTVNCRSSHMLLMLRHYCITTISTVEMYDTFTFTFTFRVDGRSCPARRPCIFGPMHNPNTTKGQENLLVALANQSRVIGFTLPNSSGSIVCAPMIEYLDTI